MNAGRKAPAFRLPDQDGNIVRLSDFSDSNVVLYFYPRAGTPGCTAQACGIRDRHEEYEQAGAVVLGVSTDDPAVLREFADEHDLPHTLLSDAGHKVAEKYGVWVEKSMYGRRHWGVQRATFVIDARGKVAHVIPKASPKSHDDKVLEALADLGAAA
jgi:thioredoxin-dependent peroxiredoxin